MNRPKPMFILVLAVALLITGAATAQDRPNILVIWRDDIGVHREQTLQPI